jgi:hypothetical protein
MREFIASLPGAVQVGLVPAIGVVVGLLYALFSRPIGAKSYLFGPKIGAAVIGAGAGGFMLANYYAAAGASLLIVWLFSRLILRSPTVSGNQSGGSDT